MSCMISKIDLNRDFVSIITIVLNGERHIEQTILSVLAEKQVNIEYIIIDGGSTDSTLDIIERYKNNIDVIISESDNGIYHAINKGINLAKGELIGIIHCGDYYFANAIFDCYRTYVATNADIIYGNMVIIDEKDTHEIKYLAKPDHLNLGKRMSIFHPSTFVTKKCYERNGIYDTSFKVAADYSLFLNNFIAGVKFQYINVKVAAFRTGGLSSSNSKIHMREIFLIQSLHLGKVKATYNISKRLVVNIFYLFRRQLIVKLIGQSNFDKLKFRQKKYKDN